MNIFVTGGTGFIGNHLIPKLVKEGHEVTCLVRDKKKGELLSLNYGVHIVHGDITDFSSLEKINVGDVDVVIHMAAMGHVSAASEEAYRKFVEVNEGGTKNLIKIFLKDKKLRKFIHISSTAAMGFIGMPVLDEKSIPNPITPYQKSKYRSEILPMNAFTKTNFPSIVLRPCMVYGPGGFGEFYKFCSLMKKGLFPKVGTGLNLTPMVYVEDVTSAIILAMDKGKAGEKYIVASENSIGMDDMHKIIMNEIGVRAPYIYIPSWMALSGAKIIEKTCGILKKEPIVSYQNIKSTITDRTFDITKIKNELGFRVEYSFEKGIKETINWYKKKSKI